MFRFYVTVLAFGIGSACADAPEDVADDTPDVPVSDALEEGASAGTGRMLLEYWDGVAGSTVAELTGHASFPRRPTGRTFVTHLASLPSRSDSYGTRLRGYVHPPTTGDYRFFVAGDNEIQLRLSTDASSANLGPTPIAVITPSQWTRVDEWTTYPGQTSAPVRLVAGQRYFLEVLHKEGTGGDGVAVGWQLPDGALERPIPGARLAAWEPDPDPAAPVPAEADILASLATGHPRVMASSQLFQRLRRELATDPVLAARLVTLREGAGGDHAAPAVDPAARKKCDVETGTDRSADRLLLIPPCVRVDQDGLRILDTSREVLRRIEVLSMVYQLGGDARYAERAIAELLAVGAPAWGDFNPRHFLDTAELGHAFAIGYDWLYHAMTETQRAAVREAIATKVLGPGQQQYDTNTMRPAHWTNSTSNWNHVGNAGLALAALAIADEEPVLARGIVRRAIASLKRSQSLTTFAPDGAFAEGPGYWGYATRYITALLASLETARGGDFGLARTTGLSEAGMMPLYITGPSGYLFNFADVGDQRGTPSYVMQFFAQRYGRPLYAELAKDALGVMGLLWRDGGRPFVDSSALPLDKHFRGVDIAVLRSDRTANASWVGFKSGDNKAGHSHLDLGSFVLDALGVRWAADLGLENYGAVGTDYFHATKRWSYYRTRAEGQNTLVINPGVGPDQDPQAAARITTFRAGADSAVVIADLGAAYAPSGATAAARGVKLDKATGRVVVQDEIRTAAPADVWWFMHTRAAVTLGSGNTDAILRIGDQRLYVKVLAPAGAMFSVRDATRLPSSPATPTGSNANSGVRKLSIHLSGVTATTLSVLMVPLPPGAAVPATTPAPTPLARW